MEVKYYKKNKVICKKCGDVLEYEHETKESNSPVSMWCKCGAVGLDPSACMYRLLGNPEDYEDLSEEWADEENAKAK